ncbi:unnamed protein product [Closterium sp. Naga37s-1]|nr:unnamed protein product [Closterium sp. Naga37s-1]
MPLAPTNHPLLSHSATHCPSAHAHPMCPCAFPRYPAAMPHHHHAPNMVLRATVPVYAHCLCMLPAAMAFTTPLTVPLFSGVLLLVGRAAIRGGGGADSGALSALPVGQPHGGVPGQHHATWRGTWATPCHMAGYLGNTIPHSRGGGTLAGRWQWWRCALLTCPAAPSSHAQLRPPHMPSCALLTCPAAPSSHAQGRPTTPSRRTIQLWPGGTGSSELCVLLHASHHYEEVQDLPQMDAAQEDEGGGGSAAGEGKEEGDVRMRRTRRLLGMREGAVQGAGVVHLRSQQEQGGVRGESWGRRVMEVAWAGTARREVAWAGTARREVAWAGTARREVHVMLMLERVPHVTLTLLPLAGAAGDGTREARRVPCESAESLDRPLSVCRLHLVQKGITQLVYPL